MGRCVGGGIPRSVVVGGGGGGGCRPCVVVVEGLSSSRHVRHACLCVRRAGLQRLGTYVPQSRGRGPRTRSSPAYRGRNVCKGQDVVCDDDGERRLTRAMHNSENTQLSQHSRHERARTRRRINIESSFTRAISTATRRQRVDTLIALTALKGHSPGGRAENCRNCRKLWQAALMQKE